MTFQLASVNKQFNTASESFQTSFRLTHKGNDLFSHEFDAADNANVLIGSDQFNIENHFQEIFIHYFYILYRRRYQISII